MLFLLPVLCFCVPQQLPAMPAIQHLCLAENAIGSLDSMKGALGKTTTLVSLKLTGNPVVFEPDYRKR